MSPPFLDTAIIAHLRSHPGDNQAKARAAIGCSKYQFDEAVQRLRFQGRIAWERFKLSPSMQSDSQPPVGNAHGTGVAKDGAGISLRRSDPALPGPSTRPGDDLLKRIEAYCAATRTDEAVIGHRLFRHSGFAGLLRKRGTLTDDKRRAVEYLLDRHPHGLGDWNEPVTAAVRKTLTELEAMGLGGKKPPCCDALLPPEGPLALPEQVKAEAAAKGERRTMARKISATAMDPLPAEPAETISDKFRRLAAEVEEEEQAALDEAEAEERRDRELNRLGSPSAVLRRAKRDWPQQCSDVAAIARELNIGLGECWRRVIRAGVDCLREGGDEGVAA